MLQMVFGHQMQMRALQLANPQHSCQKYCQQSDTPSSLSTSSVGCTKNGFMGKGTVAGTTARPLQEISLNSIYPSENQTSTN